MAHITQRTVKSLERPDKGNRIFYDDELDGFGVRITAAGAVAFVLNYHVHGRERRYTIGRWPELSAEAARNEALLLKNEIRQGKDPLQEKQLARGEPTVKELAQDYLERHALPHKRPSSVRNDREMLDNIILPQLGKLRVTAVGRRDIESVHRSLKATPYRGNRVLALLSKMFSLAMVWGWRQDNPCKHVPRYLEDKREAWLTAEQLENVERALDNYSDQKAANALRLLILTGAREGEVLRATWSQFNLERGVWTRPAHATKEKKTEDIPLSEAAVSLLREMAKHTAGPYLFPGGDANSKGEKKSRTMKARVTIRRPWVQICKAAGLAIAEEIPGKRRTLLRWRPTVRIHDLRHTYASHLVSRGVSLHIVGKLLGHTEAETTQRYAHVADRALREATNSFAAAVLSRKPQLIATAGKKEA